MAEQASTNAQSASSAREHSGSGRPRRGAIRRIWVGARVYVGVHNNIGTYLVCLTTNR